ncbi:MAG TPA: hypothetical protein VFG23_24720 [Polyangia bacterium]|nr:hypothetical protein [Polyangia bacterium]
MAGVALDLQQDRTDRTGGVARAGVGRGVNRSGDRAVDRPGGRGLQPGRHLAGVHGIDARIGGGGVEINGGISHAVPNVRIGRVGRQPAARLGIVGRAVLGNPERGDTKQVVAEHVQQRHGADHRAKQVGPLGERRADQQAAVRAARDCQPLGAGHPLLDQPARGRDEIVEDVLLVGQHARPMPGLAVLAATAQDRQRKSAAALEEGDRRRSPAGQHVDVETAVPGQQRRPAPVARGAFAVREK